MIDGVIVRELLTHHDDRGFFREIFRFVEDLPGLQIGQMSHSLVNAGIVKGWHGHKMQSQWNYVAVGKIKVALYDDRKNSKTYTKTLELDLDGESGKTYFFPPGVLHGYKCLQSPMHIIYVTSGVYDLHNDEIRVALDDPRISFDWSK